MNFFTDCLKGIAIGAGAILPGISSGVLCIIFGIYEKLLNSILNFFKDFRNNIKFLTPILLGIGIGIILFGNILNYFLFNFSVQTKSLFIGFILASVTSLVKETNSKHTFKWKYLIGFSLALLIGFGTVILESTLPISSIESVSFLYLLFSGFLMSIGVVVPGVSSTIILMLLGVYSIYLTSVSTLYFPVIIPLGIGLLIGGFTFMKITKYFLDNYYTSTFYCIIGFTLGSIFVLIPDFSSFLEILIGIFCTILGYYIAKIATGDVP